METPETTETVMQVFAAFCQSLGVLVRTRRRALGLSQVATAQGAGVGRTTLSQVENGAVASTPSLENLYRLVTFLGLDLGTVLPADPTAPAQEVRRLLAMMPDLYAPLLRLLRDPQPLAQHGVDLADYLTFMADHPDTLAAFRDYIRDLYTRVHPAGPPAQPQLA
jgi:transcriptional regulator with XRE-family HTH domain